MSDGKPKMSVSVARKKLIAFIVVGIFLIAITPAVPGLFDRFHFGSSGLRSRTEWRVLVLGLILVLGPAWVLIKFRNEKD